MNFYYKIIHYISWFYESNVSLTFSFRILKTTISTIVPEVCESIQILLTKHMPMPKEDDFKNSVIFLDRWQFLNYFGSIDWKHVRIKKKRKPSFWFRNIVINPSFRSDY